MEYNFEAWWEETGEKLCGEQNKHPCALAYAEGAFDALVKSFRESMKRIEERCAKCGSSLGHYPNCPDGICTIGKGG